MCAATLRIGINFDTVTQRSIRPSARLIVQTEQRHSNQLAGSNRLNDRSSYCRHERMSLRYNSHIDIDETNRKIFLLLDKTIPTAKIVSID